MSELNITYSNDEIIKNNEVIAINFFKKVLNLNYLKILVSEESWLSDFTSSGLAQKDWNLIADKYDAIDKGAITYNESEHLYDKLEKEYWDNIICKKIIEYYGINIKTSNIVLSVLFNGIQNKNNVKILAKENDGFLFEDEKIDFSKLTVDLNKHKTPPLSEDQIKEELGKTYNPFFYAQYAGVSYSKSLEVIEERKRNRPGVFKAPRFKVK